MNVFFFRNKKNQVLQGCIDPFNPFEEGNSIYSMTPIIIQYLTLPNSERYKNRNMDLVGVIPGPGNPYSFQPFIEVMVDELNILYEKGVEVPGIGIVRCILASFSCDYPGTTSFIFVTIVASGKLANMRSAGAFGCRFCFANPKYGSTWGNYQDWHAPEDCPTRRTVR